MTHIWLTYWHMMFIFMTHDIHDITKSRPQRRSRSRQAPSPQSPQSPAEQPWTENRWGKASKHETETYWNCRKPCLFAMSFWSLSISFLFGMKSESGKCGTAQTFAPASSGKVHWVARDGCQPCGRRSSGPIESCSNVFQCVPIGSTLVVSSPCFNWLINDNMLDTCRFMMLM